MMRWFAMLGPGLMLAAAAVGVSHLVQSTRAGADYGFSFAWAIVLIALLKYPAFRFAADYASVTGRSLVDAYRGYGRIARAWLALGFFVDMFIATAAVALVTAGLLHGVLGFAWPATYTATGVVLVTALLLLNGQYHRTERITKVLVVLFTVFVIVAALLAVPDLGSNSRPLFAGVEFDTAAILFLIAVMGWMPLPMTGSIFLSAWVTEKRAAEGEAFDRHAAQHDLAVGWILTVIVALCFVLLGTAVLFATGRTPPASAGAFANELLGMFTDVIGGWSRPLIAATAIAVMWSTVFALMDALPRVTGTLLGGIRFNVLLAVQVSGVVAILLLLMREFPAFIDFATGTGFITAPALAWYNYRAVSDRTFPAELRPGAALTAWHWAGVVVMGVFALAFLADRFGWWPPGS